MPRWHTRRRQAKICAVIGGGLLGLEAAKAAYDLGLETHVIEFAPRLMPRQIDDAGSKILVGKIEQLGVKVHLNKATKEVTGGTSVEGLVFVDGESLKVDMIIVSAGIRPRDELARQCGIEVALVAPHLIRRFVDKGEIIPIMEIVTSGVESA